MTPRRLLIDAMLAWLCWSLKHEGHWFMVYAGYLACGILIANLFRSSIHPTAGRKVWNVLLGCWGVAGVILTTRPNLIIMDETCIGFFILLLLPLAILVAIQTSKTLSVYQILMRCFLFVVATSLLIFFLGTRGEGSLLVKSWFILMSLIACSFLASIKLGAQDKQLQAGRLFISYTLRDPRGAYLARSLMDICDQIGLPYYDYVPAQEAPSAQGDRTQEIQSDLQNSVASSCCTCEIISNVTIRREWIQFERAMIRQQGLHRFFLVLDPEFLDRHSFESSGPITRIDCTWMMLRPRAYGADEWAGLTETILTDTRIKPVDNTRKNIIEDMISEVGSNLLSPVKFRTFCRDFACRLNSARRSIDRDDAFMNVHRHFQDKGLAQRSLK